MRITMFTVGSRGDVQPFVALGLGLQRAGNDVRLATHGIYGSFVRDAGLDFAPLEGNPQAITESAEGRAWLTTQRNPAKFAGGFRELMGPVVREAIRDGIAAAEGSDAIIVGGPAYYIALHIAEKLRLPFVQAYVQPLHPTGEFPSALFPTRFRGGRAFNYLTHYAGGMIFWQLMRPIVNDARRDFLGLPQLSWVGPFPETLRQRIPVLYGYSPAVLPKPRNWPEFVHVIGYWFLPEIAWTPPDHLIDFLDSGPPPVAIGFGSMADDDPARMTELVLRALRIESRRGVLLTGWGGLAQSDLPGDVIKVEHVPHDWLYPRVAAVVHHGGAGTTAAGLRAGKPSVVVPFFGDQFFWGDRVAAIGAGPPPIARDRLTAESLAGAIRRALDEPIVSAAALIGERIRAEDGVERAAEITARYFESRAPRDLIAA